ncbi:short-chain dehydrogenase of unknown substrate specificity [Thermanaerovibrio velox DSM 12556]|uniref:Short-chain alcohol dehydrogenase n=1 Tax=Thermanaerovibrio velox DSM 12556 TaxID=926567 RepID=H0UN88_9BACT|nr:short-chain dehydrogenase of unknown substrate specificity [Thermanaerovibrio velox DSM 12556]
MDCSGKVAVVTGAASGIGLGIAEGLLRGGARAVFMGDLKEDPLLSQVDRLNRSYPGRVFGVVADVTVEEQVTGLIRSSREKGGRLDMVFNVAGMGMTLPTERITFDIWRFMVNLNVMGVVYGTYSAIPIMREQGFGHVVNAGSIAGLVPVPYQAVYAATKAAVISMTESLQYELEAEGLKFSVFCPGNVRTPIFGDLEPPADSISVEEAVDAIFDGMEKGQVVIAFPDFARKMGELYRMDRKAFDDLARKLAAERRENYRTKGTYF